jgi:hypothetical protein
VRAGERVTDRVVERYRDRPLHLFGTAGLGIASAGLLLLAYLFVLKLAGRPIGHRPLLMLGVLLVVAGVQLFSVGLLGELVRRTHEEERLAERRAAREVREASP